MSIFLNGYYCDVTGPALGSLLYTGGGFGLPFFVIGASAFVLACASAKDRIVIDSNEPAGRINMFEQQFSILWLGDVPHSQPRRLPR